MILGANADYYAQIHAAVPEVNCRRVYYPEPNDIPAAWPDVPGSTSVVSIRPWYSDLIAGRLDSQIRQFIASAPPNCALNSWHEAGNLAEYGEGVFAGNVTPEKVTEIHRYVARLCQETGHVLYGPVLCMKPESMGPWTPAGMDWYGLDIYDWPEFCFNDGELSKALLYARLSEWRAIIERISGESKPRLYVCETNSSRQDARSKWFTMLGQWLQQYGNRMLTYWNDGPGGVGPWNDQTDVIDALRGLAQSVDHSSLPDTRRRAGLLPSGESAS
jgi:hypothetical protein